MINKELIIESYKNKTDDELLHFSFFESKDLIDEAVDILKGEVTRRGSEREVLQAIDIQRRDLVDEELIFYSDIIRSISCPNCKSTEISLNGTKIRVVSSFVVSSNVKNYRLLACPICLDKLCKVGGNRNIAQGLWSIPWGVIRTIKAALYNDKILKNNNDINMNDSLIEFVKSYMGFIYFYQNDRDSLYSLLRSPLVNFLNKK
jgi:hypothetical protein